MSKNDDFTERKRHKRRRDDDKKKKNKKHKDTKQKEHRGYRHSRRSSNSDADSESCIDPDYQYTRAMNVMRGPLTETPELAKDLLGLLQMVDNGEVVVIKEIDNQRIRSKLKELFPLLGLVKLKKPKGAYAKPQKVKHEEKESPLKVFQRMLAGDRVKMVVKDDLRTLQTLDAEPIRSKSAVHKPRKRDLPIGPLLPPASARPAMSSGSDDEFVGPVLPGMKGFRLADTNVEVEMISKSERLMKEQWNRVRTGRKADTIETSGDKSIVREAWMTTMPESSMLKDFLGSQNQPSGKIAAFRSKEPAVVDKTWFDLPEERERAKRAKLDMELLGYVREENAPSVAAASASSNVPSATVQLSVNESILPIANPKADERMRKQMEKLRESRGPSLLEKHKRKQAKQAKGGVKHTKSIGGWNRDRDLTACHGMSVGDAERMISAAKQINSKFTAPKISRQFL